MQTDKGNLKQHIKQSLIEQFREWPLETRLPSVRQLAADMDAAYLTVNTAMRELEWEGYVRRVPRKGTFLASRERTVRRDLDTGHTPLQTVVFAYPNYFSHATWRRLHHAEERAVRRGMALLEYKLNPDSTYSGLAELVERRDDVVGVVLIPVPGTVSRGDVKAFDNLKTPVVVLSACKHVSLARRVWAITTDWYRSGYLQGRELIRGGYDRIIYVEHEPPVQEKKTLVLDGIRQAIRDTPDTGCRLEVLSGVTRPWEDSREAAYDLTREFLDRPGAAGSGVVFESMRGVQGGLRAISEAGLRIPEDVGVISTGRGNGDEDYFTPPVTTVDPQPERELELAYACLLDPNQQPSRTQYVAPRLHPRASTTREAATG